MSVPALNTCPVFVPENYTFLGRRGPETEPQEALRGRIQHANRVTIDIGTGDGRWVLRRARANPDELVLGIDANANGMLDSARRATAKPSRGGRPEYRFHRGGVREPS